MSMSLTEGYVVAYEHEEYGIAYIYESDYNSNTKISTYEWTFDIEGTSIMSRDKAEIIVEMIRCQINEYCGIILKFDVKYAFDKPWQVYEVCLNPMRNK